MKTKFALVPIILAAAAFSRATDAPIKADAGPCCAAEKAGPAVAPKPCCAEEKPTAPAVSVSKLPLSARSLYQLDAKFTNDTGQPVQLASLRGQPVMLAMFFASCEYACPVPVSDI